MATDLPAIQQTLKRYWGFENLRPLQLDVVEAALANRDAVVIMPTGGGKSLCFQLPALITETLTVVISPLIALMKDQVDGLRLVGVAAAALNSSNSAQEEAEIRRQVVDGTLRLLYISPERLLLNATQELLKAAHQGKGVARFAIDESHCISAWGHDFRPEFRQLDRIKQVFPGTSVQAFTATATPKVQRDIAIQLNLERPRRFIGTFDRPNLTYRIVAKDDAVRRTSEAVKQYPDEGVIVYCLSRKDTERVADALVAQGIHAVAYHAGLSPDIRKRVSEDFAMERANVVVATVAFGMGIDRSNVRCVIHETLPKSMEGYQQETGRAGRDGLPSECVLLYSYGDVMKVKRLLQQGEPDIVAHHYHLLDEVRRYATSHQCRHKSLSEYFGQPYEGAPEGCGACDVCLGTMQAVANADEVAHSILKAVAELSLSVKSLTPPFLVQVLTGSKAQSVNRLKASPAFQSMIRHSPDSVSSWTYQLLDLGLLQVGPAQALSLTEEGERIFNSREPVELLENTALVKTRARRERDENIVNPDLFEALRAWRKEVAQERGVPAYVIFHDATLQRIAARCPSSMSSLAGISGMGDRRVQEFGDSLLEIVGKFVQEKGVAVDQSVEITPKPTKPINPSPRSSALFREGKTVDQVCSETGLQPSTVYGHLEAFIRSEKPDSIQAWVDPEIQREVEDALTATTAEFLKPVFDHLSGAVPYEQIRIVKAFTQAKA